MANGDSHQPWGYSHFNQNGPEPGQGTFVNSGFGAPAGGGMDDNPFSVTHAHQWQPQDSHYLHENAYPSYQSQHHPQHQPQHQPQAQGQGQAYQVQSFPGPNSHIQTHQHPQTYSHAAPISLDGQQELTWDYDFSFEQNPLTNISYGSGLQHGSHANGLSGTFPQEMPSTLVPQHQYLAEPSSGRIYSPSQQVSSNARSPQQPPPQPVAQQMNQRHTMEYQQPSMSQQHLQQQQQQQQQQHHQQKPQHQQQTATNQHQQANPLQNGSAQPSQPQTMNFQQQAPRVGTPQSLGTSTQLRQSPFTGPQVPSVPVQQVQFGIQNGRGSPAVPFSAPQQMSASKAQPNLSNPPTTQSRFIPPQGMPPQTMPAPRPTASPVPMNNTVALQSIKPKVQQTMQQYANPVQPNAQPALQPRASVSTQSLATFQQATVGVLAPPRVMRRDDNAISSARSRYVGFSLAPPADLESDAEEETPIGDLRDPDEITGGPLDLRFPAQNSLVLPLASSIIQEWSKAMEKDDSTRQNDQEQRLKQYFGGVVPKYYADKMTETATAKEKASRKPGPKRSKTRPTDEADAAEWDSIGVVYLTKSNPSGAEIGAAVAAYGKLIRGLTGEFQTTKQKFKSAKEADAGALKDKVARRLEIICRAVEGASKWGDHQILANLGGNQKLISDFVTCLIHANNSADHNGKAAKAVLRLMSEVTTMEREFLMTNLQFAKISKKFESKGDADVKELVKKIKENLKTKEEVLKDGQLDGVDGTSTPDPPNATTKTVAAPSSATADAAKKKIAGMTAAKAPSTTSSAKRPRDEESDTKSAKRVAAEPSAAQANAPSHKAVPSKVVVTAPNTNTTQPKLFSGSGMLGAKAKPLSKPMNKAPIAKPESVLNKTEVKKETGLPRSEVTKTRKIESAKDDAPVTSKFGGIGSLLDEISKPKAAGRTTPEKESKVKKDETPEEKARRLRKEKRRHLRVTWKEDDALTEVRIFHREILEDEGRASNMIRDARDDRSEGMVLKQGLQGGTQLEDEDEEDELPYRPWFQPWSINFSLIPQDRRNKQYVTRGGLASFETDQQKAIAERENKELMVIYTDPSDIPPTPKSPHTQPQEDTDMQSGNVTSLPQDEPQLSEIHLRWSEANSRGLSWARLNALRRAQKGQVPASGLTSQSNMHPNTSTAFDPTATSLHHHVSKEDQVLALLISERVRNWRDPNAYDPANPKTRRRYDYTDPAIQHAADLVEDVAEILKGKPAPPTEPPEWMRHDAAKVAEWWHGYNKDKQRMEQRTQLQLATQTFPAAQRYQVPSAAQSSGEQQAAAWAAYYAQLQQYQAHQAQSAPQTSYAQAYDPYQQAAAPIQQQGAPVQAAGESNAQLQAVLAALSATPAQSQPQPAQASADTQLQALLASLSGTSTAQQQAQHPAPNPADPDYMAYIMSLAAGQTPDQSQRAQQPVNSGQQVDDDREYDRDRDADGSSGRRDKGRGGKHVNNVPRGINPNKIGTKPCTFWAKGMCSKGDSLGSYEDCDQQFTLFQQKA
ncbi:hypothetical protein diail_3613 [Diaporthe ilicicola]|nr:hypothetical protein diail_3613 [Diaporthe ilicicola]